MQGPSEYRPRIYSSTYTPTTIVVLLAVGTYIYRSVHGASRTFLMVACSHPHKPVILAADRTPWRIGRANAVLFVG